MFKVVKNWIQLWRNIQLYHREKSPRINREEKSMKRMLDNLSYLHVNSKKALNSFQNTNTKQICAYEFNAGYCQCHVPFRSCLIYYFVCTLNGSVCALFCKRNFKRLHSIMCCYWLNIVENSLLLNWISYFLFLILTIMHRVVS